MGPVSSLEASGAPLSPRFSGRREEPGGGLSIHRAAWRFRAPVFWTFSFYLRYIDRFLHIFYYFSDNRGFSFFNQHFNL